MKLKEKLEKIGNQITRKTNELVLLKEEFENLKKCKSLTDKEVYLGLGSIIKSVEIKEGIYSNNGADWNIAMDAELHGIVATVEIDKNVYLSSDQEMIIYNYVTATNKDKKIDHVDFKYTIE